MQSLRVFLCGLGVAIVAGTAFAAGDPPPGSAVNGGGAATTGSCSGAFDCDDANACTADSCNPSNGNCSHEPVVCSDGDACTIDSCDPSASGTPCAFVPKNCSDFDPCTTDSCSSGHCFQLFAPASVVCRPTAGSCDVAEHCIGTSGGCPADALATTATICRAPDGDCDTAERCDGSSPSCPPDDGHCVTTTLAGVLCGDANDDGEVTASDALQALRTAVELDECGLVRCDYDGNGSVTSIDALAILRRAVGQALPPLCPAA